MLEKFVKSLSDSEKEKLIDLLTVSKEEKEKQEKENKKKIEELQKQQKEVFKELEKETFEIDAKLKMVLTPIIDCYDEVRYTVKGTVSSIDGSKNKNISLLNANFSDYLENSCSDILKLFPNFKKNVDKIQARINELQNQIDGIE